MKKYINSSESENLVAINLTNSIQEKCLTSDDITKKNKELQHEQSRYLNRVLEAYCDCV